MASDELDPEAVFGQFVTCHMRPTSQDQDANSKYNFNPESPANVSPVLFQGPHHPTVFHPKKSMFCAPRETPLTPNPRVLFPNPHQFHHSEQPRPPQHHVLGPRYLQQSTGLPSLPQLRHQRHSLQQLNMTLSQQQLNMALSQQQPTEAQSYQEHQTEARGHPQLFPVQKPKQLYRSPSPHPRHPPSAYPNQLSAQHPRYPPSAHPNQLQLTTNPFYMSQYSQNLRRKVISDMNYKNLTSRSLKQAVGRKNRAEIGFSSSSPVSVIQKVSSILLQNIPLESQKEKQDLNANFACELDRNESADQFHEIKTGQELARMCFSTEVGCQTDLSFPLDMEILVMPKEALNELVTANEDHKVEVEQGETGTNAFLKTETSKRESTNTTDDIEESATEVQIEETGRESLGPPLTGDQLEDSSWMDKNTKPYEAREISLIEVNGPQDDAQTPEKSNDSQSFEEQSILESTSTQDYTVRDPKSFEDKIKSSLKEIEDPTTKLETNSRIGSYVEDTVESFNPMSNFISLMSCNDPYIEAELSFMNHQASMPSGTQFLEHHYYGELYQPDDYNSENENSELAWVKDQCNSEVDNSEKACHSTENNSRNSFHSEEDKSKKAFQSEENKLKNEFHFKEDSFEITFHSEKAKLKNAFQSEEDKPKNACHSKEDKPKNAFHSEKDKPKNSFHSTKDKPKNVFHSKEVKPKKAFHSEKVKPKNGFHSEEDQPKNVFHSKEDKPEDALDSENCYTENSHSGNDVYLDQTHEVPSESVNEHASYYKKTVELVSRQNSPSTSIVINQENNNVSKSSSTSKIVSKPMKPKSRTSQNKLDRRELSQNSNEVQSDHEYLGPSTSKKRRQSGSAKSVQKEKSDVETSVEINHKPDIVTRKLSENLSENWNIPLLDAINVTKKCGFVGGITSLEKRNSRQSLGKQNEGMSQDTAIECSTKTDEKRSSRGRLLKKKNLDITSQRSPKLPAKAPKRKAPDKSKITSSKKRQNKSRKYTCAECGKVFTRHRSYTRHCRAKSGYGKARNKQKQMIDHSLQTQDSPSRKILDETADRIDIDLDELYEVATAGQGDRLLKALDKQIVSCKRTAQKNSFLSSIRRKTKNRDIERFRVPYPRVTARWTNEEQLLAVQGVRKLGKDFKVIAQILGTKTESHVRSFFLKYKEKFDLDNAFEDLEESGSNEEGEDVQSEKEGGRPKLSISQVSKTKPRNEKYNQENAVQDSEESGANDEAEEVQSEKEGLSGVGRPKLSIPQVSKTKPRNEVYDLDNAVQDFEESGANDEAEDVKSEKEGLSGVKCPKLSIPQVSKTKRRNETFTCKECNLRFPSEDALDDHIEMDWPECGELFAGSNPTAEHENNVTMGDENDATMGVETTITISDDESEEADPIHREADPIHREAAYESNIPELVQYFTRTSPSTTQSDPQTMGDENDTTKGDENDVTKGDEPVHGDEPAQHPCSPEATSSLKPFNRRKRIPKKTVSRGDPLVSHPQEDIVTEADEDNFEPPGLLIRAYVDTA